MAISVVLLEKITQITCILYFKFVNIHCVHMYILHKIIYMVQDVAKVLLKNFRITQLHVCKESGVWHKRQFSKNSKTMKVFFFSGAPTLNKIKNWYM